MRAGQVIVEMYWSLFATGRYDVWFLKGQGIHIFFLPSCVGVYVCVCVCVYVPVCAGRPT